MYKLFGVLLVSMLVLGCDAVDSMRNGFAHSQAVSDQLEKSLGLKSFVGFNWNNGTLTSVTFVFKGLPQKGSLPEIAAESKRVVISEFKQTPKEIVISFSLEL